MTSLLRLFIRIIFVLALGAGVARAATELNPIQLRCEYLTEPLGIETESPRLSWEFQSGTDLPRGTQQTAYQVLAASSEALLQEGTADRWDSGKVMSADTLWIAYAGRKLRSSERCVWKVRVWDQDGKPSPWSETASWGMGLLAESDWTAQWIGVPEHAKVTSPFFRDWKRTLPGPTDLPPARVPSGKAVDAWIKSAQIKVRGPLIRHPKIDGLSYTRERLEELQPASYLRREFAVASPVKRAVVTLCGLGCYQLRVNGTDVDNRILDPAESDYDVRAYSTAFDVTHLLRAGKNAVGVVLGDGWYRQTVGFTEINHPASYGRHGLLLQLEIEYSDGRKERVASDGNWTCSVDGPLLKNAVFAGELYDARKEMPGWDRPGFVGKGWHNVELIEAPTPSLHAQMIPPIRAVETVRPVAISSPRPGVWVYDMGVQLTGAARLKTDAPAGTMITLKYAETLGGNGLAFQPLTLNLGAKGVDAYVCRGGEAVWEPRFTYHSFRYVQMEGFPGKPTLDMLEGRFATQDLDPSVDFECSNDLLNRIHTAFVRTGMQNAHHKWTDCAAREKTGWVGYPMHMVMMHNFNAYPFFAKIVEEMGVKTRTMMVGSKAYPGVCRTIIPGRRTIMAQSLHGVLLPWELYRQYGDRQLLEEIYPTMQNTFRWNMANLTSEGVLDTWIGDWHDALPGFEKKYVHLREKAARANGNTYGFGGYAINSEPEPKASARLVQSAQVLAKAARVLGKPEVEIKEYEELAEQLKADFIQAFYEPEENSYGSQMTDAYALCLGLFPPGGDEKITDSLVQDIMVTRNGHFSTGEFGTDRVLEALTLGDRDDVAYTLMTKEDFPSFGLMMAMGSTTTWETWGEHILSRSESGEIQLIGAVRPVSHAQFLGVDGWFLQSVAGIRNDDRQTAFKGIVLKPHLTRKLDWAKADFHSPRGMISSDWKREGERFLWKIVVPPNTTATAFVPAKNAGSILESGKPTAETSGVKFLREENGAVVFELQSGSYEFQSSF